MSTAEIFPDLKGELRNKLRAPLAAEAIKEHPTKPYMSSVNSAYVIERLNDVFGEDGWEAKYTVIEANPSAAMVVVQCVLTCQAWGIVRQTFGGNDNKDRGDAYKGACTDALTKAASQIGIAQDVYKGMHDKELTEDNGKKRKQREKKPEYEVMDGIVTKYERMESGALWLQVNGNRIRVTDQQLIKSLGNCQGKRVELRCRWDAIGKNKVPCLTVLNIIGVYEPVPAEPNYESVVSRCAAHGEYPGEGNCPKCDEDLTPILRASVKSIKGARQ